MHMKSTRKTPRKARGPGRRSSGGDSADTRHELLVAARTEFALHGFHGTTVRHVADRADVTPAMIHYHFGDKRGLYRAMLEETFAPLLATLQELAASGAPGSLRDALAGYMHMLARTPELPALLVRDVLSGDGPMREEFIRDFAARGAVAMQRLIARDAEAGLLRDDLDPRFALLSLLSMAAFPFIARPIATKVLDLTYDDAMIERLATHTATLFYAGARRGGDGK